MGVMGAWLAKREATLLGGMEWIGFGSFAMFLNGSHSLISYVCCHHYRQSIFISLFLFFLRIFSFVIFSDAIVPKNTSCLRTSSLTYAFGRAFDQALAFTTRESVKW